MRRLPREQLGLIALLAAMGNAQAADALPALKVDPTLLGLPPAVSKPEPKVDGGRKEGQEAPVATATAATAAGTPRDANNNAADASKAEAAKAKSAAPVAAAGAPKAAPAAASPVAAASEASVKPVVSAEASGVRPGAVSNAQVSPAPGAVAVKAGPAVVASAVAPTSASAPVERSRSTNMAAFRVDPALLGASAALAQGAGAATPSGALATSAGAATAAGLPGQALAGPSVAEKAALPLGRAKDRKTAPTYVSADDIQGHQGVGVEARGNAEVVKADSRLLADVLTYSEIDDELEATGNVHLFRETDEMSGPHLKLKVGDSVGFFDKPTYRITSIGKAPLATFNPDVSKQKVGLRRASAGYGEADRLEFQGEDHYELRNATYSTCKPGEGSQDWFARVANLKLDYENNVGEAEKASIVFKGVTLLSAPSLSFALNNERKSGLLAPTIGSTSNAGVQYIQPYYINIAPDMDATVATRVMTRRGLQLQGEFRYLGETYSGQVAGEYLPNDLVDHRSRNAISIQHGQRFTDRFSGSFNIGHVSDDYYFNDLSTRLQNISSTYVTREGRLTYNGDWWNLTGLAQRYQTLQVGSTIIDKPYDRLPQVTLNAIRADLPAGLQFNYFGEYTSFSSADASKVRGSRLVSYPQISLPLQTAAFYVTPKLGVHNTKYDLQTNTTYTEGSLTRTVPVFSVDSGVTFERETRLLGRNVIQTLEPRLYYLRVPERAQSNIPVFDSALADFNFAQIFAENYFTGQDRIADANQLTGMVSSRVLNPADGSELMRVAAGQRWYFSEQSVTLPNVQARKGRLADYLGAASFKLANNVYLDSAVQYNPRDKRTERANLSMRYQPELGRVINAGYRYYRDSLTSGNPNALNQFDVSTQWPLARGWSGVGRINYSFKDRRALETVAGVEYNESCWAFRVVMQQQATLTSSRSTGIFFQLELNGFSSLGSSPLTILQRNVPGYGQPSLSDSDLSP